MAQSEAFSRSEQLRVEALQHTQNARQCQAAGDTEGAQREVDAAWDAVGKALEICPGNHRARFLLVSFAMNADDWDRALAEGKRIYNDLSRQQLTQMKDSVLHLSIAHACKILDKISEAITYADEAAMLFPDDPQVFMSLAELRLMQDDAKEAERHCREALRLHEHPGCTHKLGRQNILFTMCCLSNSMQQQNRQNDAEEYLNAAYEVDHNSTLVLKNLVDLHESLGNTREAIEYAEQLLRVDPQDTQNRLRIDHLRGQLRSGQTTPRVPKKTHDSREDDGFKLGATAKTESRDGESPRYESPSPVMPSKPSSHLGEQNGLQQRGRPESGLVGDTGSSGCLESSPMPQKAAAKKDVKKKEVKEKSCDTWSIECCFGRDED